MAGILLVLRAVSVAIDADLETGKLNDRVEDDGVVAVAVAVVVAVAAAVAAATAARPTEGTDGNAQLNDPGDGSAFKVALPVDLGAGSAASRSERAMASVEARIAELTAMGRCLASSIGVCNSLKVSRIFLATEADAYAEEVELTGAASDELLLLLKILPSDFLVSFLLCENEKEALLACDCDCDCC
jgi:hypothetical protein